MKTTYLNVTVHPNTDTEIRTRLINEEFVSLLIGGVTVIIRDIGTATRLRNEMERTLSYLREAEELEHD